MKRGIMTGLILAIGLTGGGAAQAEIKLPSLFGNDMVVQAGRPVPVWGTAEPGETVTVTLSSVTPAAWFPRAILRRHSRSATAIAGADGRWMATLASMKASPAQARLTVSGSRSKAALTATNVLVGQVWICSGQSNMEFPAGRVINAEKEIPVSTDPGLRHFRVSHMTSTTLLDHCDGKWEVAGSNTVGGFTAVGYFFGRELRHALGQPVGLIHSSWGGTPAEAWTSPEGLAADPDLLKMRDWQLSNLVASANSADPKLKKPAPQNTSTCLFNAMINPLLPYAIEGAIWYQGESNAGRAVQYRKLFPTMITDWRRHWQQGDFPFYFCQLANYTAKTSAPAESNWAELREAQNMTLALPSTGEAILIDIGEAADIHPRNKQEVGRRLALVALSKTYGKSVACSGPVYQALKIKGDKAVVSFTHVEGGLVARELPATFQPKSLAPETVPLVRNSPKSQLEGFAVCGNDKKWVWADAEISGDQVIVSSPEVAKPVAVRYAWANNPTCNLYNKAGLPASPFRTDDFPAMTAGNK